MAITANLIPSQPPLYATPFDATLAFCNAQVIGATGYANNVNQQLDLGGAQPSSAAGRTDMMWCVDITNLKLSANDESYKIGLVGSNDAAFGAGNIDLLEYLDDAAVAAGRVFPAILGATPTPVIPVGKSGLLYQKSCSNMNRGGYVFRYVRCYLLLGGTGPTITLTSWLSFC